MKKNSVCKVLMTLMFIGMINTIIFAANVPPSQNPPGNLPVDKVPQLVSIGFDDNSISGYAPLPNVADGGIKWIVDYLNNVNNPAGSGNAGTYDGAPARVSFYLTTCYVSDLASDYVQKVKWILNRAYEEGHEIGNHTQGHNMQYQTSPNENIPMSHWESEISTCNSWLTKPKPDQMGALDQAWGNNPDQGVGILPADVVGFRAPFLKYNDSLFTVLKNNGIRYDCSIEEGIQDDIPATNFYWPYTLDNGSPAHDYLQQNGTMNFSVGSHPGMWELPAYQVVVPPDEECAKYGINYSLRAKIEKNHSYFDEVTGKVTGLDYNLWTVGGGGIGLTKDEFVATLKYTLDLRLQGNRAPFLFGCHPVEYTGRWNGSPITTPRERQEAIEEFIQYALTKPDVRLVPMKDVMLWCEDPKPLTPVGPTPTPTATVPPTPTPLTYENIAIGKPIQASSEFSTEFPATAAVDGNEATVWGSSTQNATAWIYVDLGQVTAINGVAFKWFGNFYARSYEVYISNDAKNWTRVLKLSGQNGAEDKFMGDGSCRYIGLVCTQKKDAAFGLAEFEVLKVKTDPTPTMTPTPTTTPTPTVTIAEWQENVDYALGAKVYYNGKTYECIFAHKSQANWNPEATNGNIWKQL